MRKFLAIILVLFITLACKRSSTPDYVIPREDMVDILVDIHMMDGLFTIHNIRKDLIEKDSLNYYDVLLSNYSYTREDFDTSIFYYSMNINEYDEIYEEILNRLSKMEAELKEKNSEKQEGEKKLDDE